jgi:hypothetical protein
MPPVIAVAPGSKESQVYLILPKGQTLSAARQEDLARYLAARALPGPPDVRDWAVYPAGCFVWVAPGDVEEVRHYLLDLASQKGA